MSRKLLLAASLAVGACAPEAPETPLPPEPVAPPTTLNVESGQLSIESGALHFLPCGELAEVTLVDGTNGDAAAIIEELGGEQGIPALVVREGERLVEVRHASPEGPGCEGLIPDADVQAWGVEPFWMVRIADDTAIVMTPEEPEGVVYSGGAWSRPDSMRWRYDATRDNEALVLELTETRCTNGMSGARFPYRVDLTRHGEATSGCGMEGRPTNP